MGRNSANEPATVPVRRGKQQELEGTVTNATSSASSSSSVLRQTSILLKLPLDVFFEVASHLKPVDLLHLARVSSAFQKTLLSRTSRRLWSAARRNIVPEIPDGPDDLSEPLYARLLFERDCTKCGAAGANFLDYANYHQFCNSCWSSSVQPGGLLVYNSGFYFDPYFKKIIYDLLPGVPAGTPQAYQHIWRGPFPITDNSRQTEHTFYHSADLAAVMEEYRQVRAGEKNMSIQEFVAKYKARTKARLLFQVEIVMVDLYRREARAMFEHHMTDRKMAIAEKLRELDYDPEDYPATDPDFHSLLDQRAALTPRIWSNIKPKLLAMLQAERTRRADEVFRTKWFMRIQELEPMYNDFVRAIKTRDSEDVWARTMPAFEAAVKLPSMRALITSASPLAHVTERDFAAIRPAVVREVRAAMLKIQRHCANVLREAANSAAHATASTIGTSKGKTVGRDTGKKKDKGKSRDASEKTSEREIDLQDLFADDPAAADRALLEQPTSLFECAHPRCIQTEMYGQQQTGIALTFLGVLEHDALCHPSTSWDATPVRPAQDAMRALVPRLLDSLGIPRGTPLSALHDRLSNERPVRCSCGVQFPYVHHQLGPIMDSGESEGITLMRLFQHISGQLHPLAEFYNAHNQNTVHNITLQPKPNAYANQGGPLGQLPQLGGMGPVALNPLGAFVSHMNGAGVGLGGVNGMHPLGILQMAHLATRTQTLGVPGQIVGFPGLQFNHASAPDVPVGLTHPFVQAQMHALAGLLNQPGAIVASAREMLKLKKRRWS